MRFGIQLYPPKSAPEMAAFAKKALARYPFDKVWVPDHLTYENVFVILAAIISKTSARAGTSVVQPFSRTPLDLASSFAALAHLAGDRGVTVGIGAGAPSSDMIHKRNRVGMTRETILFLRAMFAGEKVALGEFPALADFFRLDPNAEGVSSLAAGQSAGNFRRRRRPADAQTGLADRRRPDRQQSLLSHRSGAPRRSRRRHDGPGGGARQRNKQF